MAVPPLRNIRAQGAPLHGQVFPKPTKKTPEGVFFVGGDGGI